MRNASRTIGWAGSLKIAVLALAFPALAGLAAGPARSADIELSLYRVESFIPHFPVKREMNRRYRPALSVMKKEMHARMLAGENLTCASQIYEEAHWLINYTDRSTDIEQRTKDLRAALDDGTIAPTQDPDDGSFGACFESWLWRFFRSVDPLKELAQKGEQPPVPLRIWEPVNTPEKIKAFMRTLLVSDMEGGHDKRKELNIAVTALGQLLWLDYTVSVFPHDLDRKALGDALREFVDEEWQDAETGYWGAWYKVGDSTHRTNDLSITFHIISYLDGNVKHLDRIATTTFATHRMTYPYGWHTGGTQNNHHAYDIARMINFTWAGMGPSEKAAARAALFLMMSRSLSLSIDDKGVFDSDPYTTIGEAYYFGISFFAELGLFGNDTRRDMMAGISHTESLLAQLRRNLETLDPSDPWVPAAKRKLDDITR